MRYAPIPFESFTRLLTQMPVIAQIDPLALLALPADTKIVRNDDEARTLLDSPEYVSCHPMVIAEDNSKLTEQFPAYKVLGLPEVNQLNRSLSTRLDIARQLLLTNHAVTDRIVNEVAHYKPAVTVVLLIDGLSYQDAKDWGWPIVPCFVDSPSVTYRYHDAENTQVIRTIGFAALLGTPHLSQRLLQLGFRHFRGFSYWQRGQNRISDTLFERIAVQQVQGFSTVLNLLAETPTAAGTYIQIVREGLDGLAHGKRELSHVEIQGALKAIYQDIEALTALLHAQKLPSRIYVTADHGMLWKHEHSLELLNIKGSKPRYTKGDIPDHLKHYATSLQGYSVLHYPYLGAAINANDSGVHGGLSYQESIVPFITIEV